MDANRPIPKRDRTPVEAIHARVRRYNSDIDGDSDTFRAAVLLLAALEHGQNIDVLARRTGIARTFVSKCARRLIDNGVWSGGQTVAEWSAADEASGAFWNDVAVAEGKLCRRTGEDGSVEWAPAGYWNKSYHFVDPNADQRLSTVYFDATQPEGQANPLADEIETAAKAEPAADEASAEVPPAAGQLPASADQPAGADPASSGPAPASEAPKPDDQPPSLAEIFSNAVWLR